MDDVIVENKGWIANSWESAQAPIQTQTHVQNIQESKREPIKSSNIYNSTVLRLQLPYENQISQSNPQKVDKKADGKSSRKKSKKHE
jgi:hypothetical protein